MANENHTRYRETVNQVRLIPFIARRRSVTKRQKEFDNSDVDPTMNSGYMENAAEIFILGTSILGGPDKLA